jgi:hypothetical protein
MPSLTRRRSDNPHQITWRVYYDDVRVGTIGERVGVADGAWFYESAADYRLCPLRHYQHRHASVHQDLRCLTPQK